MRWLAFWWIKRNLALNSSVLSRTALGKRTPSQASLVITRLLTGTGISYTAGEQLVDRQKYGESGDGFCTSASLFSIGSRCGAGDRSVHVRRSFAGRLPSSSSLTRVIGTTNTGLLATFNATLRGILVRHVKTVALAWPAFQNSFQRV